MSNESSGILNDVKDKSAGASPVVIDLGKKSRKRVKSLRKGKPGRLLDEVHSALEALKEEGTVGAHAQAVIVVVRERSRKNNWLR